MEDDYLQENVGYAFLTTQEAISIFADVDYALKSGNIFKNVLHRVSSLLLSENITTN